MIDTSKAKWDFSNEEKYAIRWFNENGFTGELVKQYISKTIFIVSKDGQTEKFELPQGFKGMKMGKYMAMFEKSFAMAIEYERLKREYESLT